jgi:hypothetical protein
MEFYQGLILLLVILLVWTNVSCRSVKVYRFYKPGCPYCVNSEDEWRRFKGQCWGKMINPIDVNVNENKRLSENFMVRSVPHMVAVYDDGMRFTYSGDRTAEKYMKWLGY